MVKRKNVKMYSNLIIKRRKKANFRPNEHGLGTKFGATIFLLLLVSIVTVLLATVIRPHLSKNTHKLL